VLLAALVIPQQVANVALVLMIEMARARQHLCGGVVPAMAGIFGVFLSGSSARSRYPMSCWRRGAHRWRERSCESSTSIVLPALRPILVTLRSVHLLLAAGTTFMCCWPLDPFSRTRICIRWPIALAHAVRREHVQDNELMMAGAVLTVLRCWCLFLSLQRYYISAGILMASVKG